MLVQTKCPAVLVECGFISNPSERARCVTSSFQTTAAQAIAELWWVLLTRSDPQSSIDIIAGTRTSPADPSLSPEQRARDDLTNSRAVIDACRPFHWRDQFPKVNAPSPAQARKARERFGYLLERKNIG